MHDNMNPKLENYSVQVVYASKRTYHVRRDKRGREEEVYMPDPNDKSVEVRNRVHQCTEFWGFDRDTQVWRNTRNDLD